MSKLKFKKPSEEDLANDKEIFKDFKFNGNAPSPDDDRDFLACTALNDQKFPKEYQSTKTEILNQSIYSSCVAHACASALAQGDEINFKTHNDYSRGYIYGNRAESDTQEEGMVIRQALKQLNKCGDVLYNDFPYNKRYPRVKKLIEDNKEELAEKAKPYAILEYFRCYTEEDIKSTIMKYGCVIFCTAVYSTFGRDLHKPDENNKKFKGYHAMIITGWTKDGKWIVQNSWGENWGYDGFLLMDADYPMFDKWGIRTAKGEIKAEPKKLTWWEKLLNWFKNLFSKK